MPVLTCGGAAAPEGAAAACSKIRQLSTARLFAEAIQRIYSGDSLSSLFV